MTADRVTTDEPPCLAECGWVLNLPQFPPLGFAQGCALATWEPFHYPPDGNWHGWDLATGMPGIAMWADSRPPAGGLWEPPRIRERLKDRRDRQAGGRPLWTTDRTLPEAVRSREWSVFICPADEAGLTCIQVAPGEF